MAAFKRKLNRDADAILGLKERRYGIHEATFLSPDSGPVVTNNTSLRQALRTRQITMIALGSTIGSECTLGYFYHDDLLTHCY